jgi:hypothetical protein
MQPSNDRGTLHEVVRATHHGLASLLLAAAMLVPVVEAIAGWPVHTPLGVPLMLHVGIFTALALVAAAVVVWARAPRDWSWLRWLLIPPFAVALAAILRFRANAFYTETALVEGMTALLTVRIGVAILRRSALRRLDVETANGAPSWPSLAAPRRTRSRTVPATPAVRLADALIVLAGWFLLATWTLIALAHRHPAGPLLLLTGAIEVLAFLALVPDALVGSGLLAARVARGEGQADRSRQSMPVNHDAPRPPARTHPMLRRHS